MTMRYSAAMGILAKQNYRKTFLHTKRNKKSVLPDSAEFYIFHINRFNEEQPSLSAG